MADQDVVESTRPKPWNKGRLLGQKRPLRPKDVWGIRVRLQVGGLERDLALFNLAIDSKLRACDLVALRINDVDAGGRIRERATVAQKTRHRGAKEDGPTGSIRCTTRRAKSGHSVSALVAPRKVRSSLARARDWARRSAPG